MHRLGLEKGLSDPEVINISQKLDLLMNQYYGHHNYKKMI
ncbi:MAG: aspartyl-phosphate phosphatase Spo0E family protein [Firmicutes bacterium]|nr:aspartyl-phosphate phosphatase Spo0E family protein [Bacillota bacterium]